MPASIRFVTLKHRKAKMNNLTFHLNETKMFLDITDGTAIIINSVTGIYYGINGFGTSILENLLAGSSTDDILKAARDLEGIPADFEETLQAFLDKLTGFEIILPDETPFAREARLDASAAATDLFVPTCNEYKDVQELLFADPIHEVDVDEGWMPE